MIEQAVILAAGRGTRLGELTKDRSKSMLPVLGKPIMVRVMDRMYEAGVRRFVVVVGERDGGISDYLERSWHADAEVRIAVQTVAAGNADALNVAAPHIDKDFLLTSVDNLTSLEHVKNLIARFGEFPGQIATLSLLPASPEKIRTSADVVIEDEWITEIVEKPAEPKGAHASIMLYAFAYDILEYVAKVPVSQRGEREIASAIQAAIADGRRISFVETAWRLHLTRELDLHGINMQFLDEGLDCQVMSDIPDSVRIVEPVRIEANVAIEDGATIGPNVYLESGVRVGQGAVLSHAIVLEGGVVEAHSEVYNALVDRRVTIVAER